MLVRASTFDHGVLAISGPRGPAANLAVSSASPDTNATRRDAWERDAKTHGGASDSTSSRSTSGSSMGTLRLWNAAVTRMCVSLAGQARESGTMLPRAAWEKVTAKFLGWSAQEAGAVLRVFHAVITVMPDCDNNNSNKDNKWLTAHPNSDPLTNVPVHLLTKLAIFVWIQCLPLWVRFSVTSGNNKNSNSGHDLGSSAIQSSSPSSGGVSPSSAQTLLQENWPTDAEVAVPASPNGARMQASELAEEAIRNPERRRAFLRANAPALNQILLILCRDDLATTQQRPRTGLNRAPWALLQAWDLVMQVNEPTPHRSVAHTLVESIEPHSISFSPSSVDVPLDVFNRWLVDALAPVLQTDGSPVKMISPSVQRGSKARRGAWSHSTPETTAEMTPNRSRPNQFVGPETAMQSPGFQTNSEIVSTAQTEGVAKLSDVKHDTIIWDDIELLDGESKTDRDIDERDDGNNRSPVNFNSRGKQLRTLQVEHCRKAYLYLLEPFAFAALRGCTDCTVVVGAVGGVLTMDLCENVRVITAARQIVVRSCIDCTLMVHTCVPPVLTGDCHSIRFGPYNTYYPMLQVHLRDAGLAFPSSLSPVVGAVVPWSRPVVVEDLGAMDSKSASCTDARIESLDECVNNDADVRYIQDKNGKKGSIGEPGCASHSHSFELVTPVSFRPFTVPVLPVSHATAERLQKIGGLCTRNPFPVGTAYAKALFRIEEEMKEVMQLLQGANDVNNNNNGTGGVDIADAAAAQLAAMDLNRNTESGNLNNEGERADIKMNSGTDGDRVYVRSLVQSAFKDWLVSSGNYQQLADLVRHANHSKSNKNSNSLDAVLSES